MTTPEELQAEYERTYALYHKPKAVKKKHPEKTIRDKIVKYLEGVGALVLNTPAGLMTVEGRTFSMGEPGRADLHVCYRGRFIAIETKAPGKQPTDAQLRYRDRVIKAGGVWIVADCIETVKDLIGGMG